MILNETTKFGFIFGQANVTRRTADDKKGSVELGVSTGRHALVIRVTKTGHVRVFKDGVELK